MVTSDGPRLIELCGKVRDGLISREELTELEQHLLHDPEAMLLYRHFMAICSGLEQLAGAKAADEMASTDLVCEPDGDLGEQRVNQSPPKSRSKKLRSGSGRGRSRGRRSWAISRGWAIVGIPMIAMLLVVSVMFRPWRDEGLAILTNEHQCEWEGDVQLKVNDALSDQQYVLSSGAAELRFANGAELLVQAPSVFTIGAADKVTLQTGALTLTVPETARGFRVETPAGTVIDLGTRIGVLVDDEDRVEVHVFEGQAESRLHAGGDAEVLEAGQAVAMRLTDTVQERIVAQQVFFAEAVKQLHSLPVVSGDIELLVAPPRSVRRTRSELVDLGRASLFPELMGVKLKEPLLVTMTEPGSVPTVETRDIAIEAGAVLDCYMVHLAVPRKQRNTAEQVVAEGSFTFARPIVGIVTHEPNRLHELFSIPLTDYPNDRRTGLEDDIGGNSKLGDSLALSADRRTLTFRLHVHGRQAASEEDFVDQFRVLVASQ